MVEMYTMQKYLQYHALEEHGLLNFDAWASTFGGRPSPPSNWPPEGTGYRAKTRFSRFYNLPELMSMFKEVADIQTADMLNLPVPKANYHNIVLKPSEQQKEMVAALGAAGGEGPQQDGGQHRRTICCSLPTMGASWPWTSGSSTHCSPDSDTGNQRLRRQYLHHLAAHGGPAVPRRWPFLHPTCPNPNEQGGYEMADFKMSMMTCGIS